MFIDGLDCRPIHHQRLGFSHNNRDRTGDLRIETFDVRTGCRGSISPMILSSNDTANQISFLILKDFESTNLARTLNALVGVFRFETDVGRRETLLVTVDVAVVQTGDARWRRTAAEIRWRKRRNWNVLVRIQKSWTCRRCRRGCQFSIDDGLFFNRNDLIPLINYYSIIMLLCISNGEEIHGISAGLCFSPLGFSI